MNSVQPIESQSSTTQPTSVFPSPTCTPRASQDDEPSPKVQNDRFPMTDVQCLPAPTIPRTSKAPASHTKPSNPRPIDTLQLPFPKTLAELAALDATREIPYLKALCNRRHIHVPGVKPTPSEIIPIVEQRLSAHELNRPDLRYNTDLATEWQALHQDLSEFLTSLRALDVKIDSPKITTAVLGGSQMHATHPTIDAPPNVPAPRRHSDSGLSVPLSANSALPPEATPPTAASVSNETPVSTTETSSDTAPDTTPVQPNSTLSTPTKSVPPKNGHLELDTFTQNTAFPSEPTVSASMNFVLPADACPQPATLSSDIAPDPSPANTLRNEIENCLATHQPKCKKRHPKKHTSKRSSLPSSKPTPRRQVIKLTAREGEIYHDLHNSSPLDSLSPERQQKLYQLLQDHSYRAVLRILSLPEPTGWGLQTSLASLQRFIRRYEKRQLTQQLQESEQLTRTLLANKEASDAELLAASTHLANLRLLQLANNPDTPVGDLKGLFQIQIRLKSLDLAQQRLDFQKEKHRDEENPSTTPQNPIDPANSTPKSAPVGNKNQPLRPSESALADLVNEPIQSLPVFVSETDLERSGLQSELAVTSEAQTARSATTRP